MRKDIEQVPDSIQIDEERLCNLYKTLRRAGQSVETIYSQLQMAEDEWTLEAMKRCWRDS